MTDKGRSAQTQQGDDAPSMQKSKWNARHQYSNANPSATAAADSALTSSAKDEIDMTQIDNFEAMLKRGQDSEMLRYTLGNAYYKEKQFADAEMHLRKAVEMKPDYSTAWKLLGRVLSDAEQYQDALQAFDSGLIAAKENGDKQVEKEIGVFRKRVLKRLDSAEE